MLSPQEIAKRAVGTLDSKKGTNIRALKVEDLTVLANYFIICTATSTTHIKTLADEVEKALEDAGERTLRREGYRSGGWILIDFGCVVVHLFLEEVREFYHLERLWGDAEEIVLGNATE